ILCVRWWSACLVRVSGSSRRGDDHGDGRGYRPCADERGSAGLLAEFRSWLDRERGLSPVSVRCYSRQAKYFLAAIGGPGAVSGLDAAGVTVFMVEHSRDRNTWSAKAMVTSLRAFLRFAHATGRLAGAVPAVASWRLSGLPRGLPAAEVERLLAGCGRDTAAGVRDYAVLSLLARLGLRGAEAAGLQIGDIDWPPGETRRPSTAWPSTPLMSSARRCQATSDRAAAASSTATTGRSSSSTPTCSRAGCRTAAKPGTPGSVFIIARRASDVTADLCMAGRLSRVLSAYLSGHGSLINGNALS
ncbi:MAG: tyrosine-type recombinase/integrase, partial [Streptosporangiaceae bacterium]